MNFLVRTFLLLLLSNVLIIGLSRAGQEALDMSDHDGGARSIDEVLLENARSNHSNNLDPFGSNLFNGAFRDRPEDALNPKYVIAPGDKVAVRIWGATAFDDVLTVDLQGNIFIPTLGPIRVGGVPNSELTKTVTQSVHKVFKDSVNVYTTLNTAQPVAVFVTGSVSNPGRYTGVPSSSALYFLDSAGGIDSERGSYRTINVIRDHKTISSIDLYEFLLKGLLDSPQYQNGDTIFVESKASSVSVDGEVRNRNHFELQNKIYSGSKIIELAIPTTMATHVSVSGFREGVRFARYMSILEFSNFIINNGDQVTFKSDIAEDMIVVEVEGEFEGQSQYVLPKNSRIMELLDYIKINPNESQYSAISIKRRSIAERQRTALNESLNRIESAYFRASSHTNEEAAIRAQESKMISEFITRARKVEPNGRLVLAEAGAIRNVRLEMGDVITIPQTKESVMVNGEVMVSQAILWSERFNAQAYIDKSGGYTDQANKDELLVLKQSGEVIKSRNTQLEPGDEIIVLPKVPVKSLQLASTLADILYKIAIAASVAVAL